MRHTGNHSFGAYSGSAAWVDFHRGHWFAGFAYYNRSAAETGRDNRFTSVVQFDEEWRQKQSWVFPPEVVSRLGDYSISGGAFGRDGLLYCTGHDHPEVYVLSIPEAGSTMKLIEIIPVPFRGQGIAWDNSEPGTMSGIDRRRRQVVVARIESAKRRFR